MMMILVILASLVTFFAVMLWTQDAMVCEALRVIPGVWFPLIWLAGGAAVLGLAWLLVNALIQSRHRKFLDRISEMTITHTEIPHLYPMNAQYQNGYYLLRLYLRGIIKHDAEGKGRDMTRLTIGEKRLEAIKAEGGRHSRAAVEMVRFIRSNPGCSITQVLNAKSRQWRDRSTLRRMTDWQAYGIWWLAGLLIAVLLGLAWGILNAKVELGYMNDKPVGFLLFFQMTGFVWVPLIWTSMVLTPGKNAHNRTIFAVLDRLKERPHQVDERLMRRVIKGIPIELDRNRLLNAYFVDRDGLLTLMNAKKYRDTFLQRYAYAYKAVLTDIRKAERKAEAARKSKDTSGCGSCGSCSSCGGCGGCGGCGD